MGSWDNGTSGLVVLPDGRRVRGRALGSGPPPASERPELSVQLDAHAPQPLGWEVIWICWPDFWTPRRPAEAIEALRYAHEQATTRRVEIACRGGVGRTGTAMALLARLAGVQAADAVRWTRDHYQSTAIETPWQRTFVARTDLGR